MRLCPPALVLLAACAQSVAPPPGALQARIERAADVEGVPRPLLLAIAWVDSRMVMEGRSIDGAYGLTHLIDRADAPEALSLRRAASLTGVSEDALRTDPFANARGGAALLRAEADKQFAEYRDLDERRLGDWWMVVMRASGSDDPRVADSYASQVYRVLRDGLSAQVGEEAVRLVPQEFDASARFIWGEIEQDLSGEYCPNGACVAFVPASTSNYTAGRDGLAVTTIVIHDMEGSYSGSISWFQNPSAQASAHYMVRSSDGEITQMVHDGDTAWHAGNWDVNQHAVGIEHEGYAHTGNQWYTEAMYRSSAGLTRWLADTFHVVKDRAHIIGHYEVPDPNHSGWYGGASHHHDPCDSWVGGTATWHNVSACYWDWAHYMDLVTGTAATGALKGFVGDDCCGIAAGTRQPIAGATVVLKNTSYTAKTDSTGTYSFTLPPGNYTPVASMSGYDSGDHTSLGSGYPAALSVTSGATTWGSIVLHKKPVTVTPPAVTISAPAEGAALIATPVQVRGTVSDASVTSVRINGHDFAASGGAFSGTADLAAGANTITVSATNSAGTGTAAVHVSYAPPQTGVQGTVRGPSGAVSGAGVTAGDQHAVTASDGSYLLELAPGGYTLAVDANGFQAVSQSVTVPADRLATVDVTLTPAATPPHVRIDSPRDGAIVDSDKVFVSGVAEVSDLAGLTVNGEQVEVDAHGGFTVQVSLHAGNNELVIVATRAGGQTVETRLHVEYAPQAQGGGCASAGAGLWALLGLAFARRRK